MEYTVRQIRPKLLSVTGTQNKNEEIEITKEFLHPTIFCICQRTVP